MIDLINYPPQIDKKVAAFVYAKDDTVVKINVPYILNKALSFDSFNSMSIIIRAATTNQIKWRGSTNECKMYSNLYHSYYASFAIPVSETFTPIPGNYYKIQIAFENTTINQESKLSSVGVVKCTNASTLKIDSLTSEIDNISPDIFIGVYENKDTTEKIYSYNFTIYDDNGNIFDTSGDIIHNGTSDEVIVGVGVRATFQWKPKKEMAQYVRYRITLTATTINDYRKTTAPYVIKAVSTVDANIPAKLLATPDYDNGCIHLSLIKPYSWSKEEAFSGSFLISRYSSDTDGWDEVCRFNMLSQTPGEMGVLWTDYTVAHGVKYIYALQAYNSNHLYSNKMYHVMPTTGPNSYLEYDEFGKPIMIMGDFEDMFLTDSTRQLKIRFNPQVSNYKPTILENKIDTLGGKYPFIFRNGNVNYKEFSISGLLSYLMDEKELFMTGIKPPEDTMVRSHTPAAASAQSRKDWLDAPTAGSNLTSQTFYRERQFKTEVLEWLTNGEPKLFRSAGEGNFIVRLMNVSLSPNDTLGRMLHTFNSTAYEIDELTFENLKKYNLLYLPEENNSVMKFTEVNLSEHSKDGVFSPGHNMYHVSIVNASPYTQYSLRFNELVDNSAVIYQIGLTGCLYLDSDAYPVTSIKLEEGDETGTAILRYGYYDTAIPDNFNDIASISMKDEAAQVIGFNYDVDILKHLSDKRKQIGKVYSLIIKPRHIVTVKQDGLNYYDIKTNKIVDLNAIHTNIYAIIPQGQTKVQYYYYYINGTYKTSEILPEMKFKLNNHVIDMNAMNKHTKSSWAKSFIEYTQGSYRIECDLGEIKDLYLGIGTYAEICYELKEIKYAIEEKNESLQNLYKLWKSAIENYEKNNTNYDNIKITYTAYVVELTRLLEGTNNAV